MRTFSEFLELVEVHTPREAALLAAVLAKRTSAAARRRGDPSLADAITAELVREIDPDFIVTTDVRDFRRLLPDFADAILAPADLLKALGATP